MRAERNGRVVAGYTSVICVLLLLYLAKTNLSQFDKPHNHDTSALFCIIFINDLSRSAASSLIFPFANDTKCAKAIHSFSDTLDLQHDFIALGIWARKWNVRFNESKCIHLRFLPNSHPAPELSYSIFNSAISLPLRSGEHMSDISHGLIIITTPYENYVDLWE